MWHLIACKISVFELDKKKKKKKKEKKEKKKIFHRAVRFLSYQKTGSKVKILYRTMCQFINLS